MGPSRFSTFVVLATLGVTTLLLLSSSTRQTTSHVLQGAVDVPKAVKEKIYEFGSPRIHFTFPKSAHKPPVQTNSTVGDASWHSDWRWLNPFSSFITWDQERVVLPPLPDRPYVYTYYDTNAKRDKEQKKADEEILLTWKRAWWAQGFKPVVLTTADAMNHPLYQRMRATGMQKVLEFEFERMLAWGHMGTGLLASWQAVPMAAYDDPHLVFLRHGQYEQLIRYEKLGPGLFVGDKASVNSAIQDAINDAKLGTYKTIIEAFQEDRFKVEDSNAIAYYDFEVIMKKYSKLWTLFQENTIKGQQSLNQLINAHLHTTWQNTFADGIRVLKPLPAHTSKLVEPGQHLGQLLTECPESIHQSSCPPNNPRCSPCVGARMRLETKPSFLNSSTKFHIATVPHPFTMITLNNLSAEVDARHIRRNTDRDTWIRHVTRDILGDGIGGPSRVIGLKSSVASEFSKQRGIWFTVEHFPTDFDAPPPKDKVPSNEPHPEKAKITPFPENWLENIDWFFGFSIPRTTVSHGEGYNPVPGQSNDIKGLPAELKGSYDPEDPTYKEAMKEIELLKQSRETINSKDVKIRGMRDIAEAWNLADTEVWKFVRAFRARAVLERQQWWDEELQYTTSGSRGGRWF